jgi:sigma-B regulation protein RsbU (phosphoserine phosphatase)
LITRFVAILRAQPRWVLVLFGLLWVGVLALLDYLAPLELSFLTFYVAPILFLVWFVGPAAGFLGAAVSALFWVWEDVLSSHAHPTLRLHVTDWNLAVRAAFLALFVWVVAQLKRALERERQTAQERLERDVEIAEEVQTRLFPRRDPEIPGLDCHGTCRPARGVAGDYYDFLTLGSGLTGIAVGDVAGKGLPAALLMASLQGSLRSLAPLSKDGPAGATRLVGELNSQLHALTESNRFATFFWATYDERERALTWVNAGHNAPMLLRGSGDIERLPASGPPLGALPRAAYRPATTVLAAGDLLVVFTDGVIEAVDAAGQEFGDARLERLLRDHGSETVGELCDRIVAAVRAFEDGAPQNDDITLVVARAR